MSMFEMWDTLTEVTSPLIVKSAIKDGGDVGERMRTDLSSEPVIMHPRPCQRDVITFLWPTSKLCNKKNKLN